MNDYTGFAGKPKKVSQPVNKLSLTFALDLLAKDQISAFETAYAKLAQKYGNSVDFDAYMETICDRDDLQNIAKMLNHWTKYLDTLPSTDCNKGASLALSALAKVCVAIDKLRPPEP